MPALTPLIKETAHAGDISALLSVHGFCKSHNVNDHPTFNTILDIVFHNLRPELHPNLNSVPNFPKASRTWLKAIAISICALVECLDSMIAASSQGGNVDFLDARFLQPIPISGCRRIAKQWEKYIWPCVSALTDHYILDDFQPPISDYIHQDTLHTIVSKLFMYLVHEKMGLSMQLKRTESIALCAMHLLVRSVERYPHPSGDYVSNLCDVIDEKDTEIIVFRELKNSGFLPAFLAFLPQQGTRLDERHHEYPMVLVVAYGAFQFSSRLGQEAAERYPALLDELLRAWRVQNSVHMFVYEPSRITAFGHRQSLIMQLVGVIGSIIKHGGWIAQKQALQRHILRTIIQPVSIEDAHRIVKKSVRDLVRELNNTITSFRFSLCQYSILTSVLRELDVIRRRGIDKSVLSSNAAEVLILKESWVNFHRLSTARAPLLEEYSQDLFRGAPFCNMKSMCPRDVTGGRSYKCSVCKATYYCSRRCQKKHWNYHKKSCQPYNAKFQPDERDMDFLEFQLGYDLQHNWRATMKNPERISLSDMTFVLCDYNVVPPQVSIQPADFEHLATAVRVHPQTAEGPESVLVIVVLPDIQRIIIIPYFWITRNTIVAALTPRGIARKKGERLIDLKGILRMPKEEDS